MSGENRKKKKATMIATFRVPVEVLEKLRAETAETKESLKLIVRKALEGYINESK
jgi:predicted DNA-binding protein